MRHTFAWLLLAAPVALAAEATVDEKLAAALTAFVPDVIARNGTPGLNLAVAREGRTVIEAGFGMADIERAAPMRADTVMRSGSMGKLYTAVAILQLVEQGVLKLDEAVAPRLGIAIANPLGARDVTVEDLLTHRSGLSSDAAGCAFGTPRPLAEHLVEGYARTHWESWGGKLVPRWTAKVGEKYQYSNFGIATLGLLVERVNPEKLSFSRWVETRIMEPLAMRSSRFPPVQDAAHLPEEIVSRLSSGYARLGASLVPTPLIGFGEYPAGTAVLTPGDHLRFLLALERGGELDGKRVLAAATVKEMMRPRIQAAGRGVGLVVGLVDIGQPDAHFSHAGGHMFGWRNDGAVYPTRRFALVVATNQWTSATRTTRAGSTTPTGSPSSRATGWRARRRPRTAARRAPSRSRGSSRT